MGREMLIQERNQLSQEVSDKLEAWEEFSLEMEDLKVQKIKEILDAKIDSRKALKFIANKCSVFKQKLSMLFGSINRRVFQELN